MQLLKSLNKGLLESSNLTQLRKTFTGCLYLKEDLPLKCTTLSKS